MAKPEWGTKRTCQSCGARFYDLLQTPIICPKCGAEHDPLASIKQSRGRAAADVKAPAKKPAKKVAVAVEDDDVDLSDDAELDLVDDDEEEDGILEDASELGEDEDVIEPIDDDDEKHA